MRGKHQTDNQSREAIKRIRKSIQRVHGRQAERFRAGVSSLQTLVATALWAVRRNAPCKNNRPQASGYSYAAFFAGCAFLARDLPFAFPFAPVSSRLFCKTETRSITLVGFGAFLGFSSISFPPASTFSSITSMSASRWSSLYFSGFHF